MIQITDVSTPMLDFTFVLYLPFYNTDIGIPENKYYICPKIKLTDDERRSDRTVWGIERSVFFNGREK